MIAPFVWTASALTVLTLSGMKVTSAVKFVFTDGSVDTNFTADVTFIPDNVNTVNALAVQTNGAIIVAGGFGTLAGQTQVRLGRVSADEIGRASCRGRER